MAKDMLRQVGRPLIVGSGVVLLTPMVSGLLKGITFMSTKIWGDLTIGIALSAGVAAFAMDFVVNKYLK